jgi:serine/threonine protein kinase
MLVYTTNYTNTPTPLHTHTHAHTAGGSSRHEHKQPSRSHHCDAASTGSNSHSHSDAGSDASQSAPAALCTAAAAAAKASTTSSTSNTNHSSTNNSSKGASPQQLSPRSPGSPRPALHTATTFVGTVTYMSPERINGEAYSYSSDVWSLGLSLLTTALGKLPLDTKGGYWSVLHAIRDAEPPCLPQSQQWSKEIRSFINACLTKDPRARPDCAALLLHPFVRGVPDKVRVITVCYTLSLCAKVYSKYVILYHSSLSSAVQLLLR